MTSPFVGEIQIFGFNFAPRGWAFCSGALIAIQQNTALFSLLGTQYGGNGTTNFALPNFASSAACRQGNGPGLTPRVMGEFFGEFNVTLGINEMPAHSHAINAFSQSDGTKKSGSPATNAAFSTLGSSTAKPFSNAQPDTTFAPNMIGPYSGGATPHQNQQPYLALNFCIALQGVFPARN